MEEAKLSSAMHADHTRNSNCNKSTNDGNYMLLWHVLKVDVIKTDKAFSLPISKMGIKQVQRFNG